MINQTYSSASVYLTADNNVGGGKPTRVFTVCVLSGETPGAVVLRNGTTDAGTIYFSRAGDASKSTIFDFGGEGILFPDGLFYDHDAGNTSILITCARGI